MLLNPPLYFYFSNLPSSLITSNIKKLYFWKLLRKERKNIKENYFIIQISNIIKKNYLFY